MIYIYPAKKAEYLRPEEAEKLKEIVQQILKQSKKQNISPENLKQLMDVVLTRLLHTCDNLAIYDKRFVHILEPSKFPAVKDFDRLGEASVADKKKFSDYFPNNRIAQACFYAAQAVYRIEKFNSTKNPKTKRSAIANLKKLMKALRILSNPQKALEAFLLRFEQYRKEIAELEKNIPTLMKQDLVAAARCAEKIVIEDIKAKESATLDNIQRARAIRDANLNSRGKNAPKTASIQPSFFEKK